LREVQYGDAYEPEAEKTAGDPEPKQKEKEMEFWTKKRNSLKR